MTDTSSGISPETLKPEARQFLERVGHFVIFFSMVENMMQRTLWHFAGVNSPIAPAIFSGTRTDASKYIKRIADATGWPKDRFESFEAIMLQLGEITQTRNDLLHYGITGDSVDTLVVSNSISAHIKERVRTTKISSEILEKMSFDLFMICFQLKALMEHVPGRSIIDVVRIDKKVPLIPAGFAAWQYKPERQGAQAKKNRDHLPKPQRHPKSSRTSQRRKPDPPPS
jgi:hypothetical protein